MSLPHQHPTLPSHQFENLATSWWDTKGPMRLLHEINPIRIQWLLQTISQFYGHSTIDGLRILDIGAGGGILCESLARLGASVTGIDTAPSLIQQAKDHARENHLAINYHHTTAEDFAREHPHTFDIITCFEVIEHVESPKSLIKSIATLLKKDGMVLFSTPNRTFASRLVMKGLLENITRILPKSTHDWQRFLRPSELARFLEEQSLTPFSATGLVYNPIRGEFTLAPQSLEVNYFLSAVFKAQAR